MRIYFHSDVAKLYGIEAAIIYDELRFREMGSDCTLNGFQDTFPFLTSLQIQTALNKLENAGVIVKVRVSDCPFDDRIKYDFPHE